MYLRNHKLKRLLTNQGLWRWVAKAKAKIEAKCAPAGELGKRFLREWEEDGGMPHH